MTENTFAKIYGIAECDTGRVMYIGKAANPKARMQGHIRECKNGKRKTPIYLWMNSQIKKGKYPTMIVLASAISQDWQSLETQMIAQYRTEGHMLNLADGGDQPKVTLEGCKKGAHALNARLNTDPTLRRIQQIKRHMSQFIKDCAKGKIPLEVEHRIKEKLRLAGYLNPKIFGEYRTL